MTSSSSAPLEAISIVTEGNGSSTPSYTTHDTIKGHVNLRFAREIRISNIIISLQGITIAKVPTEDRNAPAGGFTTGRHNFLHLRQLVQVAALFDEGVARANFNYSIPFTFLVPKKLLPGACDHGVENDHVKQAHLGLPPALNHSMSQAQSSDEAPVEGLTILYRIHAQVLQQLDSGAVEAIGFRYRPVHIIPGIERSCSQPSEAHIYHQERVLKKGLLGSKIGTLEARIDQVPSLHLSHPRKNPASTANTKIPITIKYDATSKNQDPPRLRTIKSVLEIQTSHSSRPYTKLHIPNLDTPSASRLGSHTERLDLASLDIQNAKWLRREDVPAQDNNSTRYTTSILVPIAIAQASNSRIILPSFHSCLAFRVYVLELTISFHFEQGSLVNPTVRLRLPISITSEPGTPPEDLAQQYENQIVNQIDRDFGLGEGLPAPEYTLLSEPATTTTHADQQDSELPSYESDTAQGLGARGLQPISTGVEVKPMEWMNIGTPFVYGFRKLDSYLEKRERAKKDRNTNRAG